MDHDAKATEQRAGRPLGTLVKEFVSSFLAAPLIVLAVNLFVAQPRTVEGESMEPNLHENERLIVELLTCRFSEPERGSIVVLNLHERNTGPVIKRVIGLAGELVEIREGQVYIDGQPLEEPYLQQPTTGAMPPTLVPEGHVFVLGDNRNASNDSRYFGMVPYHEIIGRAWLRYWPLTNAGPLP